MKTASQFNRVDVGFGLKERKQIARAMGWTGFRARALEMGLEIVGLPPGMDYRVPLPDPLGFGEDAEHLRSWWALRGMDVATGCSHGHALVQITRSLRSRQITVEGSASFADSRNQVLLPRLALVRATMKALRTKGMRL